MYIRLHMCVCVCIRLSLNHSLNSVRYLRLIIQRKVHKCLSTICTESTSVNVYVHNYAQAKHAHIHEQYVNTQINTNTHKYLLIYILLHQYAWSNFMRNYRIFWPVYTSHLGRQMSAKNRLWSTYCFLTRRALKQCHLYVHICMLTYMHSNMHTYKRMYMYIHTHTNTHIHIYT